jgi:hypothetical protein
LRISWKSVCEIETLTKQCSRASHRIMPHRGFCQFPLTHQMSYSLLCGFCTPETLSKFWTSFEQCTWF